MKIDSVKVRTKIIENNIIKIDFQKNGKSFFCMDSKLANISEIINGLELCLNQDAECSRLPIIHTEGDTIVVSLDSAGSSLRQIEQSCGKEDFLEIKIFEDGSRGGYRHEVKLGEKLFYSGGPH